MKRIATVDVRPVKVVCNGAQKNDAWAQIRDLATNEVLHTGQLRYIRNVAKKRYLKVAEL